MVYDLFKLLMKIVIADGYTLNPGDLSWESISALGNVTIYERTTAEDIYERCREADIILTNKVPFTKETIGKLNSLKLICVTATGYNVIDTAAAKEKGILVCNVPAYGTASVAQHTIALLLELSNRISVHSQSVANGEWVRANDWCYTIAPIIELAGKTLGIVGMGNIGSQVARIATALGMHILYNSRTDKKLSGYTFTDIQTLFAQSDIVTLHCPLTAENTGFVNMELLKKMQPSAFIINTARGQLINEKDLANALQNNTVAGAALDVLSTEPPKADNPLLHAKNCVITPHNAWISKEARQRVMAVTTENIKAFLKENPVNRVI